MISQKLIERLIAGEDVNFPVVCLINDFEHLAEEGQTEAEKTVGTETNQKWKLFDSLKDEGVTVLDSFQAHGIINALGLVPALHVDGQGSLYDTPDGAFKRKFQGQKVYVTV